MRDTIFALSSGAPPAAIAVLRVSGPAAFDAVARLAGPLPVPRVASLRTLRTPGSGLPLDRGLVILFPGPDSATGEDVAELHVHGGMAVIRAITAVLTAMAGLRGAEPGEFTRRALEAGRIDLTEAEGLADLLAAETERQRRAALRSADGGLRGRIEDWTSRTLSLAASLEAVIDHGDEEHAIDEAAIVAATRAGAKALAREMGELLAQPPIERLRDGIRVVLAGPPNSGKSTLLNAMAGREVAIVSPIAGTTRDRIEAPVLRDGIAWLLTDTAGLVAATADPIEAIGVSRARDAIDHADILVWMGDGLPDLDRGCDVVLVHARCDETGRGDVPGGRVPASGMAVGGTSELWRALEQSAQRLLPTEDILLLNMRQRMLCADAMQALLGVSGPDDPLVMAEEIRLALRAFDRLTGHAAVEQMLDILFFRFCIGK